MYDFGQRPAEQPCRCRAAPRKQPCSLLVTLNFEQSLSFGLVHVVGWLGEFTPSVSEPRDVQSEPNTAMTPGENRQKMDRRTILITDDSPSFHARMDDVLGRDGHRLLHARSGAEALEWIERDRPDVAFVDIHMPGMNGLELIRRLRERIPDLPIFAVSSGSLDAVRDAARRVGANAWLAKPAPAATLRSAASLAPRAA